MHFRAFRRNQVSMTCLSVIRTFWKIITILRDSKSDGVGKRISVKIYGSISITDDLMSEKSCDIPVQHITRQEHLIATRTQEVLFWRQHNDPCLGNRFLCLCSSAAFSQHPIDLKFNAFCYNGRIWTEMPTGGREVSPGSYFQGLERRAM